MSATARLTTAEFVLKGRDEHLNKTLEQGERRFKSYGDRARRAANDQQYFQKGVRGTAAGVAALDGPLGGIASRITAVNSIVTSGALAWAGMGAAIGGAVYILGLSLRQFSEMEQYQLRTEALVRSTGQAAGFTADQLDHLARSSARSTLFSTRDYREGINVLQTFRTVSEENFTRTIGLAADLAVVMKSSVSTASQQLGRALEEPEYGLTALRRSGVSFLETERELIIELARTGRLAEAQGLILDKLAAQVGGAAVGASGGLAGKVDSLKQSWEEMLEAITESTGANEIAGTFLDNLGGRLDSMSRAMGRTEREQLAAELRTLQQERRALENQVANPSNFILGEFFAEDRARRLETVKRQIQEVDAALEGLYQQSIEEENRARENAAQARAEQEEQRSIAFINNFQKELASEREELRMDHEKKLQQIQGLTVQETELRRMGFETVDAMREHYSDLEVKRYNDAVAEVERKEEERLKREADRARREREQQEKTVQSFNKRYDDIRQMRYREMEDEQALEDQRHRQLLEQLQAEREAIAEHGAMTAEIEQQYRDAEFQANLLHEERSAKIREDNRKKDYQQEVAKFSALLNLSDEYNRSRIQGENRYVAMAINLGRMLLDEERRNKLKEATMEGKTAIIKAWNSAPFPANVPAVTLTTAAVAANIAEIAAIAHGGLNLASTQRQDEVTVLAQRGERILSKNQNQDLTRAAMAINSGRMSLNVNIIGAPSTPRVEQSGDDLNIYFEGIENRLADRIASGRGPLSEAISSRQVTFGAAA